MWRRTRRSPRRRKSSVSTAEMGELFKVIALGKGVSGPLLGFERGDKALAL